MAKKNAFATFTVLVGVAADAAAAQDSLDGIDTTYLESGAFGWVKTGPAADTYFRLDITSVLAPDGVTIIEPLVGPGRWLEFSGGGGAACLIPRFHEIYVDANTTTPPVDQNGSLSCPYDSIQTALDTIPPLDPLDFQELQCAYVLNVADGVYDEDVTMPSLRTVTIRATGGAQNTIAPIAGISTIVAGPGVFIIDPTFTVTRTLTIEYSGLTGSGGASDIPPQLVFEGLAVGQVEVNADGSDPTLILQAGQTWKDCTVVAWDDVGQSDKYAGLIELRNTSLDILGGASGGTDATFDCEHSVGGSWGFITRMRSDKCVFDELVFDSDAAPSPPWLSSFDMTDTIITTDVDEFVGGGLAAAIRMDSNTVFWCELLGSMSTTQVRSVQDLTAESYQHLVDTGFSFGEAFSTLMVDASLVDPSPISLPLISGAWARPSVGALMARQAVVKNRSVSSFDVLVSAIGGDTIEGGASVTLAPGEGAIFVPRTATDWERIATI